MSCRFAYRYQAGSALGRKREDDVQEARSRTPDRSKTLLAVIIAIVDPFDAGRIGHRRHTIGKPKTVLATIDPILGFVPLEEHGVYC